jgi:hypothetical protein
MTQSTPFKPSKSFRLSAAPRPEHDWISDGSTLNPFPGVLLKRRRDTAEGCRERASDSLLHATTLVALSDREAVEDNAASWSARAELLQHEENNESVPC